MAAGNFSLTANHYVGLLVRLAFYSIQGDIPMIKKLAMLICVVATVAMTTTANAQSQSSGQSRTVGQRLAANQLVPIDQIDHSAFDQLLKKYVDTDGRVNYRAWDQSSADRNALTSYLNKLSSANSDLPSGRCLLYTSPSPRDQRGSRMPSSA